MRKRLDGKIVFGLILGIAVIVSCKKVIQVDLKNAPSRIVIEGEITNTAIFPRVRISRSVNFSALNSYPPVSGARVRLTDSSNGLSALMQETDSGVYTSRVFGGVPRHVYQLEVTVDGKTYNATSRMPVPVPLDSVTFASNTDLSNKQAINAIVNFQDPVGPGNYYEFTESVGGRVLPNVFVFEDRLSDGRYIKHPLFNDSSYLQKGDTLLLTMNCVDKNVYEYFLTMASVTGNNNFQTLTPANPITNISNGALGYFSAHTMTMVRVDVY